jgi:DNA-binding PadR family transcriptional regulator
MWKTRLLILGLVRWLQPVHGYEVQRELLSWGVEDWLKIKPGSIYHALKKLAADGAIEVVSTEQVDNRPARTSYRITAKGEQEFQSVLRERLWNVESTSDPFWVAWSFSPVLDAREAAAMLHNRAGVIRDQRDALLQKIEAQHSDDPRDPAYMPEHVRESLRLEAELSRVKADWCERVAKRIETGELPMNVDATFPQEGVAEWKRHIATLEDPPEA